MKLGMSFIICSNALRMKLSKQENQFCPNIIMSGLILFKGSSGGRVVKLLACGARGPGFDSRPRHLNFQRLVISASKSRYGWKIAKSTLILKTTNQPTNQPILLNSMTY